LSHRRIKIKPADLQFLPSSKSDLKFPAKNVMGNGNAAIANGHAIR
jgi:hypothetical protein